MNYQVDGVSHSQEQYARILHPPFRVRDGEVGREIPMIGPGSDLCRRGYLVLRSVDAKHTVHLHV